MKKTALSILMLLAVAMVSVIVIAWDGQSTTRRQAERFEEWNSRVIRTLETDVRQKYGDDVILLVSVSEDEKSGVRNTSFYGYRGTDNATETLFEVMISLDTAIGREKAVSIGMIGNHELNEDVANHLLKDAEKSIDGAKVKLGTLPASDSRFD